VNLGEGELTCIKALCVGFLQESLYASILGGVGGDL
jgi:hypothetical protein